MKCAEANLVVLLDDMQVINETSQQEDILNMSPPSNFNEWILAVEETISKSTEWNSKEFQLLKEQFWAVSKLQNDPHDNLLQLCKSVIECLGTKVPDNCIDISIEWLLTCGLISLEDEVFPGSSKVLEFIDAYLDTDSTKIQRNVCIVLSLIANLFREHKKPFAITKNLTTFLHQILANSTNQSTVLHAVICLDALSATFDFKNQITDDQFIIYELEKLAIQHCENVKHPDFNSLIHQIKFVSQHLIDKLQGNLQTANLAENKLVNVFTSHNQSPLIKLSHDNLEARSDWSMQSYQAQFEATTGVYFYEVTLLTSGPARIGWSSKKSLKAGDIVGSDHKSIGYDGYRNWIWHDNRSYPINSNQLDLPAWKSGDVVGCLIDLSAPQALFTFYLNGIQIKYQSPTILLNIPLSPTVSLSVAQQCIFNFGSTPFQYLLDNVAHQNFIQVKNKEVSLFTESMLKFYTENCSDINVDSAQQEFDLWLLELEFKIDHDFASGFFDWQYFCQDLNSKLQTLLSNNSNAWRLFMKAVIRVLGVKLGVKTQQTDVLISWLSAAIKHFTKLFTVQMSDLEESVSSLVLSNDTTNHNLLVVFLLFFKQFDEAPVDILQFLYNVSLNENCLYLTRLYALICLHHFDADGKYLKSAELGEVLSNLAHECFEMFNFSEMYDQRLDCGKLQLGFYAKCITLKVSEDPDDEHTKSESNSLDQTQLSQSCDHLFARNDILDWKKVIFLQYFFSTGIYFYEVVLLTSSLMKVGWAIKRSEEEEEDAKLTISFDGHHRILWHEEEGTPKMDMNRWKAGDVLGCLIKVDSSAKTISTVFYLNGREVSERFVDTAYHSYAPAVSLGCHQQVYVNLGQAPFQHPPNTRFLEYSDLHSLVASNGGVLCQLCQTEPHSLQFSKCNHWRFCLACAPKITPCPTCCNAQKRM